MPALISGYEHDVFISYRHKDNLYDGWVTEFVSNLKKELEATFKKEVSVYFDSNPHAGLLETHDVDKTLHGKIKCLILIPIVSQTYCDPDSFAWKSEFIPFLEQASSDSFGLNIRLPSGSIASRVLPVRIHDLDADDLNTFNKALGGQLRAIDFTYKQPGVNRPIRSRDDENYQAGQLSYRDQINKVANAIKDLMYAMRKQAASGVMSEEELKVQPPAIKLSFYDKLKARRVFRVAFIYVVIALIIFQLGIFFGPEVNLSPQVLKSLAAGLIVAFPLVVISSWFYELSPRGLVRIDDATQIHNPYDAAQRKPFTSGLLIMILIGLLTVQTVYFRSDWLRGRTQPATAPAGNAIAVLPLKNLTSDIDNEFFSDGLTEDIITQLSKIASLKVISRSSIVAYKASTESLQDIAASLNVSSILEGSVQRSGDAIRVRVQLFDVAQNKNLWAETFDRKMMDILELQTEIARSIAQSLKANLSEFENQQLDKKPTLNYTAYEVYMRGREHYYKYEASSNQRGIEEFKKAIALDPNFSLAWAGLGDAYSQAYGRFGQQVSWIDSSIAASTRAVKLDSNLSEGYKALANAYNYVNQYDRGFALLQKAVSLNPNNAQAVGNLGTGYFLRGELDEALHWEKRAAGLNPKSFIPFQIVGWTYRQLGDYDQAESWLKRSLELKPFRDTYEHLALTYIAQGEKSKAKKLIPEVLELEESYAVYETAGLIAFLSGDTELAKEYFQKSVDLNDAIGSDAGTTSPIYLGYLLLQEGRKVDAEVYLANAFELRMNEMEYGSLDDELAFYLAGIKAAQGDVQGCIDWLQVARKRYWVDYKMASDNLLFSSVHADARFQQIMSEVKANVESMRAKAR